ncbi:ABC transporter permease [Streptomyces zhihengii]|uniref:ABC transporter permease n=1 Tax=Streptomyces zhihengii TaxID=1818004 RepID=UPI00362F0009
MSATTATAAGPAARRAAGRGQLAGTGALLRLALRRDRVVLPLWILVTALLVVSGAGTLEGLYATPAERAAAAASMNADSSMRSLVGPVFGDSVGALVAWRFGVFAAVLAAVMSLVTVVRHTREEEETGRQELLSAAVVGRRAPLTAALLTALTANLLVAAAVTAGLAGRGAAAALALGLAIGGTGMVFGALAAVVAQITESARLAKGATAGLLGLAFALRAAGDSQGSAGVPLPTRLSPLGWAEHVRPYAPEGERWWLLPVLALAAAAGAAAAYALAARRDVGMSFLPASPGPAEGRIATAAGLARRLQRGASAGWAAAFLAAGAVFGGMADGAAGLVGDNAQARGIFERMGGSAGLTDAFLATMAGLFGMIGALYTVASVMRLHGEETSGRAEPVLASAVGRIRWAAGHLVIAFGGSAVLMLLAGTGLWLGHGRDLGPLLAAALVQLPAMWTLGGLAVLLHGALPRAAVAAWGVTGAAVAVGWIGPALDVPRPVLDLSPFGHLPKLPGGAMTWPPVAVLLLVSASLTTAGLVALRRRDVLT